MRFVSVIVAGRGGIPGLYRGSGRRSAPEWRPPRPRPRCVGPPAAMLRPDVSEMVAQGRLEKARAGWEAKCAGGCSQQIGNNLGTTDPRIRSHAIVGQMTRVRQHAEYRSVSSTRHSSSAPCVSFSSDRRRQKPVQGDQPADRGASLRHRHRRRKDSAPKRPKPVT